MARNRRERLYAATVACVAEHGYEATTVAHLCDVACVSRTAFYGQFNSKQDCFVATMDDIARLGRAVVEHAIAGGGDREERLRVMLETMIAAIAMYPETARLYYVDAYAVGAGGPVRMEKFAAFDETTIEAVAGSPERAGLPPEVMHAVLGGIHEVVEEHLREGREQELPGLVPDLWHWALSYVTPSEPLVRPRRRSGSPGTPRRLELNADERILQATTDTIATQGYTSTTVADISRAASVSLTTFYANFDGKEEAVMAALEQLRAQCLAIALPAFTRAPTWEQSVANGLRALLSFLAVETRWAGFAAEVRAGGARAAAHIQETMRMFGELLAPGEEAAEGRVPAVTRSAVGGAIFTLTVDEVVAGREAKLSELVPIATFIALAPYVGVDEAAAAANSEGRGRASA